MAPEKRERVKEVARQIRRVFQKFDIEKLARRIDQQTDTAHLEKAKRRRALDYACADTDTAIEDLAETILSGGD